MKQSETIAKLAVALVAAQAEFRAIAKESVNPHFKSKFASLDTIIEDVRPILAKHGLAVIQSAIAPESDAQSHITALTVETTLVHSSGEWLSSGVPIPLAKADPQGAGAAMTYGRRYSLSALLCLATEDDDDGNSASRAKGNGRAASRSTAANQERPSGTATAQPPRATVLLTRQSTVPFGNKYFDWKVSELPYDYLQWATHADRKPTAFGPFTTEWRKAFQAELDGRESGEFVKEEHHALAAV